MNFINCVFLLATLHCVADYPLQGDFLANFKGKNNFILFVHSIIWSGVLWSGLFFLGRESVLIFPFLLIGHFFIDKWKCNRVDKSKALTTDLYIDQFLHMVQIAICFMF